MFYKKLFTFITELFFFVELNRKLKMIFSIWTNLSIKNICLKLKLFHIWNRLNSCTKWNFLPFRNRNIGPFIKFCNNRLKAMKHNVNIIHLKWWTWIVKKLYNSKFLVSMFSKKEEKLTKSSPGAVSYFYKVFKVKSLWNQLNYWCWVSWSWDCKVK